MKANNGRNGTEGFSKSFLADSEFSSAGSSDIWDEARLAALLNFDEENKEEELEELEDLEESESSLDGLEWEEKEESAIEAESNAISQAELFDDTDEPHAGKTPSTFSGNPLAKLGSVALGLFVVFGIAAIFLNNIMGTKIGRAPSRIETGEKVVREPDSPISKNETGEYKTQLALSGQEEQIKALSDARNQRGPNTLKQPDKPNKNQPKPLNSQPPTTPQPSSAVPRASELNAPPTYSAPARPTPSMTPAPTSVERSEPLRRTPRPEPVPEPISKATPTSIPMPIATPTPLPTPTPTPIPTPTPTPVPVNPMAQWQALRSLGSYGESIESVSDAEMARRGRLHDRALLGDSGERISPTAEVTTVPRAVQVPQQAEVASGLNTPQTAVRSREVLSEQEQAILDEQREDIPSSSPAALLASSTSESPTSSDNNGVPDILQQEEAILMQETPPNSPAVMATGESFRRLEVGQQVSAFLVTPVVGFESARKTSRAASIEERDTERFVVQLKQSLVDKDGTILFPAQLLIIFEVQSIAENGLIDADAVALVDGEAEYRLPPGVLSIRGEDGSPFIATAVRAGGSEIFSRDSKAFALGALAKVGEILNRPESEEYSESHSDFSSRRSSRVNRGQPNLLGAVLEGGFSPLVNQVLERNQKAIDRIQSRPPIWVAEEGKQVQVFVNSTFEF